MAKMTKAENTARDVAAMDAGSARAEIKGNMTPHTLDWYLAVETRPSLRAAAEKRLKERDPTYVRQHGNPESAPKEQPEPDADLVLDLRPRQRVRLGATINTERAEVAANEVVASVLDKVDDPPVVLPEPEPELVVLPEPEPELVVLPEPEPESKLKPRKRKSAMTERPTVRGTDAVIASSKPASPTVRATNPVRSTNWSDAEIAGAIAKYGATIVCTKCGIEGPLLQWFGLRRVGGVILKQPQCRKCRSGAAALAAEKEKARKRK